MWELSKVSGKLRARRRKSSEVILLIRAVHQKRCGIGEKVFQGPMHVLGKTRLVQGPAHHLHPAVAGGASDGERSVAHAEPGMAPRFKIGGRPTESKH